MTDTIAETMSSEIRSPVVKALVIGDNGETRDVTNQTHEKEHLDAFNRAEALEPPYSPSMLAMIFEHSNSLRQNVEAYAVNIDGFGHHLEPVLDMDGDDLAELVGNAIYLERLAARARKETVADLVPTDA